MLVVLPDKIVTENAKDAEMLASTLALYELCKGQVSKILPSETVSALSPSLPHFLSLPSPPFTT